MKWRLLRVSPPPTYEGAARLGRTLARSGLTVATGGGPGAMEAANLGAYAAPYDDEILAESLRLLAKAPKFTPSITAWAAAGFEVRTRRPKGGTSVGIPTWFYGHESRGEPTPMVLVGRAHWTEKLPAWPLLQSLARGRSMGARIALVERIEEAPEALARLGG